MRTVALLLIFIGTILFNVSVMADVEDVNLDDAILLAKKIASSTTIIATVKRQNLTPSPDVEKMTNKIWTTFSVDNAFVLSFAKNSAAEFIQNNVPAYVSEAFVNDAKGRKVAFLAKTSSWIHAGKEKHDVPMSGTLWRGKIELDESTGVHQIQISVPILEGKTALGSLVLGIAITKYKRIKRANG